MHRNTTIASAALIVSASLANAGLTGPGGPDTETFLVPFADIGQTLFLGNGIIPGSNDFDGGTVIDARLQLTLTVEPTLPGDDRVSDAAFFEAEAIVPVDVNPMTDTNDFLNFVITGQNEGWSGTGTFTIDRQLDELIGGEWVSPVFYSASTYDGISQDQIVLGTVDFFNSYISVTVQQVPAPASLATLAIGGLVTTRRRRG